METRRHYDHVVFEHEDGVTLLRCHTDGGSMVWGRGPHEELPEAYLDVAADPATKVVILTGTGDDFCTSIDRASFREVKTGWDDTWWGGKRLLHNLVDIDVPVISVVNGPATIHAEIAILADVVLAADTALFQDAPHFAMGVAPGDGVHVIWPYLIGETRAKHFLLTNAVISASEALALGFVNEVHPPGMVLDRAWEIAREISGRASLAALRMTRAALNIRLRALIHDHLSHGLALEALAALQDGNVLDEFSSFREGTVSET